jgi:hypothetical protein
MNLRHHTLIGRHHKSTSERLRLKVNCEIYAPAALSLLSLFRFVNVTEITSHLLYKQYVHLPRIALPESVTVIIVSTRVMHATDEK